MEKESENRDTALRNLTNDMATLGSKLSTSNPHDLYLAQDMQRYSGPYDGEIYPYEVSDLSKRLIESGVYRDDDPVGPMAVVAQESVVNKYEEGAVIFSGKRLSLKLHVNDVVTLTVEATFSSDYSECKAINASYQYCVEKHEQLGLSEPKSDLFRYLVLMCMRRLEYARIRVRVA